MHVTRRKVELHNPHVRQTILPLILATSKLANLEAAVSLYVAYYNWCWRSRGKDGKGTCGRLRLTPAMQAGLTDRLWKLEDLYDAVMAA